MKTKEQKDEATAEDLWGANHHLQLQHWDTLLADEVTLYRELRKQGVHGKILVVKYHHVPLAQQNRCFRNVGEHVKIHGGKMVVGWALRLFAPMCVELMAHAIWRNPDGVLIDITPWQLPPEYQRRFIIDKNAKPWYTTSGWFPPASKAVCCSKIKKYVKLTREFIRYLNDEFEEHFRLYGNSPNSPMLNFSNKQPLLPVVNPYHEL